MSAFSEFIRDFCIVAVSSGLIMLIAPCGKLKRQVNFIISLCTVCALLSAIVSVSGEMKEYLEHLETDIEAEMSASGEEARLAVAKQAKKNMEQETERLVCAQCSIDEEDVLVIAEIDASDTSAVEVVKINVFLNDTSLSREVSGYVAKLFENEVEVVVMQKGGAAD